MSTATLAAGAIARISTITVQVRDQEQALRFYVEKLGFEKRMDAGFGETFRWLTVAPAGAETEVVLASGYAQEAGAPLGGFTGMIFETENMEATHRALAARGVHFTEEPALQPWGAYWATFVDQDGNGFGLVQQVSR